MNEKWFVIEGVFNIPLFRSNRKKANKTIRGPLRSKSWNSSDGLCKICRLTNRDKSNNWYSVLCSTFWWFVFGAPGVKSNRVVFALGEFEGEGPYGERLEMFCSIPFISNCYFYDLSQPCPEETFAEIKRWRKNMKRKRLTLFIFQRCCWKDVFCKLYCRVMKRKVM